MSNIITSDKVVPQLHGKQYCIVTPLRILEHPLVAPLGPLSLRSYVQTHGFDGDILDFNAIISSDQIDDYNSIVEKTITQWIDEHPEAVILGINVLFSGVFIRALEIAKIAKKHKKDLKIVFGGIHPTIHHKEITENCDFIDNIVIGEGERQFLELLKLYTSATDIDYDTLNNGVTFRNDDEIKISERKTFSTKRDIGELGKIDYSPIDFTKYHTDDMDHWYNPLNKPIISAAPIVTSRSCPFRCNFCSIHWVHGPATTFRYRPSDDVVDEFKYLYYEKGINYFYIVDDCSTCGKKKTMELYSKIAKSDMDIMIEFQNGLSIRTLDEEVIDCIVSAGMIRGGLAIESGSERIRNTVIEKGLTDEKIHEVYNYFRAKHPHVWLVGFFIIGLPEETQATLEDNINFINGMGNLYPVINRAVPTPGTKLWNQCLKDDLLLFDKGVTWRDTFIFASKEDNMQMWTMKGLDVIDQKFVIKPYELDMDTLHHYYDRLMKISDERLRQNFFSRKFTDQNF